MQNTFTTYLFDNYDNYVEKAINKRRFKHRDLVPLIMKHANEPIFEIRKLGQSVEFRDIFVVELGTGKKVILLWSQMHGNEPTATQALLDIFNFFEKDDEMNGFRKEILEKCSLYFVPMLNPDGAEVFKRENSLNIDINRDAQRLACPESQLLKSLRDELKADFGFNLHDQTSYYRTGFTQNPATIAFLSPSFNYEKTINEERESSMKVIALMNNVLQQYIPNHVARYNDEFEPRAFGDNIQKWGTKTILIESGAYPNDPERQFVRKLNFVSIMSAIYSIATDSFKAEKVESYFQIPNNKKEFLFDLIIRNAAFVKNGIEYPTDIAINRMEKEYEDYKGFYHEGVIADIGDLSVYNAYQDFDAKGLKILELESKIELDGKANFLLASDIQLEYEIQNGFLKKFEPTKR